MTVKDLTENYEDGTIVIIDANTNLQACICGPKSIILDVLANKKVVGWRSVKSSNAKIEIRVDFS